MLCYNAHMGHFPGIGQGRMSRIRWYHIFFVLSVIDAGAVVVSLEWHRQTLSSVDRLIERSVRLDEQSRWLRRVEQGIIELGEPGNDLFESNRLDAECVRYEAAQARMRRTIADAGRNGMDAETLRKAIGSMELSTEQIFSIFQDYSAPDIDVSEQHALLQSAARSMAQLDQHHVQAMRVLGLMTARCAAERDELLHRHEYELQNRVAIERYFIACVVVILVGLLYFGRRMRQTTLSLEAERRRAEEERRERLASIGELCSSVAHGIRNPLAAIRSSAQLSLEQGQIGAEGRERLTDILDEAQRLGDRVTGLLNMARINSATFSVLNLEEVTRSAVRELQPEMRRLGLSVDVAIPREQIELRGDRRQLEQAIIELLSNAMEHSPAGGTVGVRCEPPNGDGRARISIEDEGPGVPVEVRPRIFDLFFTTKPSGTGIGLATVKRIARLHEGDVALESTAGGGARFVVSLPATQSTSEESSLESGITPPSRE